MCNRRDRAALGPSAHLQAQVAHLIRPVEQAHVCYLQVEGRALLRCGLSRLGCVSCSPEATSLYHPRPSGCGPCRGALRVAPANLAMRMNHAWSNALKRPIPNKERGSEAWRIRPLREVAHHLATEPNARTAAMVLGCELARELAMGSETKGSELRVAIRGDVAILPGSADKDAQLERAAAPVRMDSTHNVDGLR